MNNYFINNSPVIKPLSICMLIIIFTLTTLISTAYIYWIITGCCFIILLVLNKRKAVYFAAAFVLLYALIYLINYFIRQGAWVGALYSMALIGIKLYPLWLLSAAMTSYDTSQIMNSLRYLQLPNRLCVAVAIFFRFLPDYMDYFKEIKEGLIVRGFGFDIRKPGRSIEFYIVPMINKAFATREIITASMITKGIEYNCKKTFYREAKPGKIDFIIVFTGILLLMVSLWIKYFQ